jgi:glycine/D-amino acid oxidase-like deaminating enzyme/nitrite reductase/ring-hydroxylating ferredoxin subunit
MRTSLWAAAGGRSAPRLRGSLRTDVCIVGAGMAGLSTAWRLAAAGYAVVVLDGREPGMGETSRTTAHLVTALDRGWSRLTAMHGEVLARLAADSHRAAIDEIEAVCQSEEIECHFERLDGFLFAAPGTPHSTLETELDAARRAGLADVEMVLRAPIRGYDTGPCLRFPRQAVCHPLRLLAGLRNAIARREGRVFGRARVDAIEGTRPLQVRVAGGATVTADAVVVATNSPIAGAPTLHALQAPYRTYVIAARVPRGSITNALYWDTEEPFHYVRLERGTDQHDLLIVGGEDHKTGQGGGTANECYRRLLRWARVRFPTMGPLAFHWSGQVMESADGLGLIGRGHEADLFVVTGDSGNGMTNGMVAALLLTELIAGRQSPWQAVYDPHRLRARAVGRVARENLNVAVQLADWIRPAELDDVATVAPGSGAVLRRGLRRVAVYRRPSGEIRELSAICPHLGCIVRWNAAERTWDCPCHGSRFHPEGGVISGPTTHGLAPLSVEPVALPERKRARR